MPYGREIFKHTRGQREHAYDAKNMLKNTNIYNS